MHRFSTQIIRRMAVAVLAAAALSACTPETWVTPADIALLPLTKKTGADHVLGVTKGKDCSTARFVNGEPHCRKRHTDVVATTSLYCYKTLGAVTCYDKPSPARNDVLIGSAGPMVQR